ncbi:MAG: 6-hydroxymethylpterin diphosphokinase MptE-like protein [Enterocloster bolteae]
MVVTGYLKFLIKQIGGRTINVVIDSMMYETKPKNLDDTVFFVRDFIEGVDKKENVNYLNCKIETYYPGYPKFSDDLTEGIYSGTTVLYAMFQIAVYMGFKKIYLLGVDFSWGEDGKDTHFCKGYMNDQLVKDAMIHKEAQRNAYISVKKYAEEHNIEVLNATRGGYLNVFERIEFEELFNKAGKITDDIRRE